MNHPDVNFVFQVTFLLTCLVTANSLYFVFRRYKVILKINVWIILTKLYIYQDSLPDHKQVIVNILFDQLSLLFQSGNIICGSYILMVWQVHMTLWQNDNHNFSSPFRFPGPVQYQPGGGGVGCSPVQFLQSETRPSLLYVFVCVAPKVNMRGRGVCWSYVDKFYI